MNGHRPKLTEDQMSSLNVLIEEVRRDIPAVTDDPLALARQGMAHSLESFLQANDADGPAPRQRAHGTWQIALAELRRALGHPVNVEDFEHLAQGRYLIPEWLRTLIQQTLADRGG
jgi:hypothetical protein